MLIKTSSLQQRLEEAILLPAQLCRWAGREGTLLASLLSILRYRVPSQLTASRTCHFMWHRGGWSWEKAQKSMCTRQQPGEQVKEAQTVQSVPGSTDYSVLLVSNIPELLRKEQNATSTQAAFAPALICETTSPLHQTLTEHWRMHQKNTIPGQWIPGTLQGGVWGLGSRTRSCDKSETSSHLITVHAVYELTYYFTWYTHSIPDEHRANKPLKDSCELYKYWNQTLARYQPSEMQIGTHTDLHQLQLTAFKRSHGLVCHSISTKLFHWFGIQQFGDQIQIFQLPWQTPRLLYRRWPRAGGKPLKLLAKIDSILCDRKQFHLLPYCKIHLV